MNSKHVNNLFLGQGKRAAFVAVAFAVMIVPAHADTITVVNGGFEQTAIHQTALLGDYETATAAARGYAPQQVTGWSFGPGLALDLVVLPGTADTTGDTYDPGNNTKLWGPGDGVNNGLPATSPSGGNYIAMDGTPLALGGQVPALTQEINGLTPGSSTTVSFYWAGAEQYLFYGATTEQLEVSLGGQDLFTPVLNNAPAGFTGWQSETLTFTPTNSSELLSFLAIGTPTATSLGTGVPPFVLLDGVSMATTSPVPEPASMALVATGLAGLAGVVRRRFQSHSV